MFGGRGMRGVNPRQMKRLMKELKQEVLEDVEEVIIRMKEKEIVIRDPEVVRIKMGQEIYQVTGKGKERKRKSEEKEPEEKEEEKRTERVFTEKDIQVLVEKTACTRDEAVAALQQHNGDLVRALLYLKKQKK